MSVDAVCTYGRSLWLAERPRLQETKACYVLPEVGVEPTRPEGHGILSPARLPIPPLWLGTVILSGTSFSVKALGIAWMD